MATGRVDVLPEYCKGCGLCVSVCPTGALAISKDLGPLGVNPAGVNPDAVCRLCRNCATMCPDAAIRLTKVEEPPAAEDQPGKTGKAKKASGKK